MISNIIDRRTRQYRWIEPTDHDNAVSDSDEEIPEPGFIVYDERPRFLLPMPSHGLRRSHSPRHLHLYDLGSGIKSPA